jgi:hypothetical protein
MIRLKGTLEMEDGRTLTFECGQAALAEWELYAHRHSLPLDPQLSGNLSSLVIAHYALRVEEGFDVWRRNVVGISELEAEGVPPTLREVSDGQ